MSLRQFSEMQHVAFLLAELAAELDALEARSEAVQALAQLDAREARGEPLTALCGKTLRARLEAEIATSPITAGRRKLAEFTALFELRRQATVAAQPHVSAGAPVAAAPAAATVIDLATHRERHKTAGKAARNRERPLPGRTLMSALALFVIASASAQYLPALTRGATIDVAANLPLAASGATHWAGTDGF